jgi:ankyrin repeat protein
MTMLMTKFPAEILIHIAAHLEPDGCYRLIQAVEGLDQLLTYEDFMKKARRTGDTIVHLAARKGDEKLIQNLLARAVNIEVRNKRGVTPLAQAAHRGHKAVVELLISAGASVDESDSRGLYPLHGAAYHGSDAVVQVLTDAGANVFRTSYAHGTALHMAIKNGHLSTVSLLLEKMRQPPDTTDIWRGALDLAAEYGRTEVFHELIKARFKFTEKTLQVAASSGRARIVKFLLSQVSFPENVRRAALLQSVKLGYPSVVRLLIGTGFNISGDDPELAKSVGYSGNVKTLRLLYNARINLSRCLILCCAASRGHTALVEYFVHSKWLNHDMCRQALLEAASAGQPAVVKALLDSGFVSDKKEKEKALEMASTAGHLAVLDLLLEPGTQSDILALYPAVCAGKSERIHAILNREIDTSTLDHQSYNRIRMSLKKAAESGHATTVELLLNAGVVPDDPHGYNGYSGSALYKAAKEGHMEVVDLLVKAGADISCENHGNYHSMSGYDEHGYTALYVAAGGGHVAVTDYLISAGAPVSLQGAEGHTALHAAARAGHIATVALLINAGANLSIRAHSGATPLHYAAQYNRAQVVKLLLNSGSDPSILDREERSALSRAFEFGHAEVVGHLIAAGKCMK